MLVVGGMPAMLLFVGFLAAIAYSGVTLKRKSRFIGDALLLVSVVILVSAIFNSTIKDYGEKHALLVVLALLGGQMIQTFSHRLCVTR